MEIRELSKGDIFEVVRNSRRYKFIGVEGKPKSRDFPVKCLTTGKELFIHLKTKVALIKGANDGS